MQQLPCCYHGAWHCESYRYLMHDPPLRWFFIASSVINAPNRAWTTYAQCAEWHYPANVRKRLGRDNNYHVMIVIRIWATHFHKESFHNVAESQKAVSKDYSLLIIIQACLDLINTDVTPITSNYDQWCLQHKRSRCWKGHWADFAPCLSILVLGILSNHHRHTRPHPKTLYTVLIHLMGKRQNKKLCFSPNAGTLWLSLMHLMQLGKL